MCVCDNAEYFYSEANGYMQQLGLTEAADGTPLKSSDLMDIIDGYKGLGYALSTDEELSMCLFLVENYCTYSVTWLIVIP